MGFLPIFQSISPLLWIGSRWSELNLKLVIYKTISNVHFFHQNCDLTLLYRRNTKELLSPFNGRLLAYKYNQSQWHGLSIKQSFGGGKDSYLLTCTLNICTHFVIFSFQNQACKGRQHVSKVTSLVSIIIISILSSYIPQAVGKSNGANEREGMQKDSKLG